MLKLNRRSFFKKPFNKVSFKNSTALAVRSKNDNKDELLMLNRRHFLSTSVVGFFAGLFAKKAEAQMIPFAFWKRRAAIQAYVDDVFSTYLYTGNGSTQTITNGIDLAGKGGLVWIKCRDGAVTNHTLFDTARGVQKKVSTNSLGVEVSSASYLTAFNSTGFSLGSDGDINSSVAGYTSLVSWSFRKATKFFDVQKITKSAGSNATVDLSSLGDIGMIVVKRTSGTGSWYVYHKTNNFGKLLLLESSASEFTSGTLSVFNTTLTLVDGVISDGSYIVYAWAHDSDTSKGIIQCGGFSTDSNGEYEMQLGWEPQFVILKGLNTATSWKTVDSMRGFTSRSTDLGYNNITVLLYLNTTDTEQFPTGAFQVKPNGFKITGQSSLASYVYLAIRRSNKPPTLGTQVYNAIARIGTGAAATVTGVGFPPDAVLTGTRSTTYGHVFWDRLRGANIDLQTNVAGTENYRTNSVVSFDMDGMTLGIDSDSWQVNKSGITYINYFFKRALGVFDIVCYTGTGTGANTTNVHNLGVTPELMIIKVRDAASSWPIYHSHLGGTIAGYLNSTSAPNSAATHWNNTNPTSSVFTIGTSSNTNASGASYVAYLFASKTSISKVGNYTGNGSFQTINCSFTTGARFILIKRTDSTGDWYVWDTTRGIVAGNDSHLSLNTSAIEVTSDDSIDSDNSGFVVNQVAATNINVTSATYIFLAMA